MKECKDVKRMLSRYLDKETLDSDTAMIEAHLDNCLICKEELLALMNDRNLMAGIKRKPLPRDYLVLRLRERIADERRILERFSLAGMGEFARKLIPVPVVALIASIAFLVLTSMEPVNKYSLDDHIFNGSAATAETALELILGSQN